MAADSCAESVITSWPAVPRIRARFNSPGEDAGMTSPIRVLMVTSDWLWNSWGGPAVFIARQVECLRREGIDVDLFPFKGARQPRNYVKAWWEVRNRLNSGSYDLIHA